MEERKRILFLIGIMIIACLIVSGITMSLLYGTAFDQQKKRLIEIAQSQARLIEAVARFDAAHEKANPESCVEEPAIATISQVVDAHKNYTGFGETGEFTLSRKEGNNIVFLLSHRHFDLDKPKPVSMDSNLAEPMRLALSGKSGTIIGLDYRGQRVLAAFEPVDVLNLGIVAKIDLAEVRSPFIKTGFIAVLISALVVFVVIRLFFVITNPMLRKLEKDTQNLNILNQDLTREIEERKQAEGELMKNQYFLQKAQEIGKIGTWELDIKKDKLFWTDENHNIFGVPRGTELTYEIFQSCVHPDDREYVDKQWKASFKKKSYDIEHRLLVDGKVKWVKEKAELEFNERDECVRGTGVTQDITERKKIDMEIKASLKEKEILLRELYHRTKNNMQVISGLLTLQSAYVDDKKTIEMFREIDCRIMSMALVHQKLYQSNNLSQIDLKNYIEDLTTTLFKSYQVSHEKISLTFEMEHIPISVDMAIPCGLIINELMSNVFKYAFPANRSGEVKITLHSVNKNELVLRIKDNGVGISQNIDLDNPTSLGLQLIDDLVTRQLRGKLKLNRGNGTEFIISFKEISPEPRV